MVVCRGHEPPKMHGWAPWGSQQTGAEVRTRWPQKLQTCILGGSWPRQTTTFLRQDPKEKKQTEKLGPERRNKQRIFGRFSRIAVQQRSSATVERSRRVQRKRAVTEWWRGPRNGGRSREGERSKGEVQGRSRSWEKSRRINTLSKLKGTQSRCWPKWNWPKWGTASWSRSWVLGGLGLSRFFWCFNFLMFELVSIHKSVNTKHVMRERRKESPFVRCLSLF